MGKQLDAEIYKDRWWIEAVERKHKIHQPLYSQTPELEIEYSHLLRADRCQHIDQASRCSGHYFKTLSHLSTAKTTPHFY